MILVTKKAPKGHPPEYRVSELVANLVKSVNIGTNLAIWHVLMTVMSGRLLASRGA
jgi:hypothetical protein